MVTLNYHQVHYSISHLKRASSSYQYKPGYETDIFIAYYEIEGAFDGLPPTSLMSPGPR